MTVSIPAEALSVLREALLGLKQSPLYKEIVEPKEEVLAQFQPLFTPEHVRVITAEEFTRFLLLKNNRHWSGLHRQGPKMCADMEQLRKALALLVDEAQPVAQRLEQAIPMVQGIGKNVATAILLVTQPDKYGVWNNPSEAQMRKLGLWPQFARGESFGKRYEKVNQIMLALQKELQIDLWTLDALWWYLDHKESRYGSLSEKAEIFDEIVFTELEPRFALERHLHDFLRDNWEQIELGHEWALYSEPENPEAGYEYPTDVGKIDLLARHKNEPRWLVIELKRNQSSDETVGQVLRYIGWVKQNLAEEGEEVHGLIICHRAENSLLYALKTLPHVELRLYEVEFRLREPEVNWGPDKKPGS